MKQLLLFGILVFSNIQGFTQTISVTGQCIASAITLNKVEDVNGKIAFQGTGTVDGNTNVTVNIYWLTPEDVWVLDFDGQPYFYTDCDRSTPPSTTNATCSWTTVEGQECTGGAELSITGTGTLPVRLRSFTATKAGTEVKLRWTTALEANNKGFDMQRSSDGYQWTSIGFVKGAGNSSQDLNYTFNDAAPLPGKNYYRLVQIDYNNRSTTSSVISIEVAGSGFYTVQSSGAGKYALRITSAQPVELTLLDVNGKKLFSKSVVQGVHPVDLTPYTQGIYLLRLRTGNLFHTEKLIK